MENETLTTIDEEVLNLASVEAPHWFINPKFKAAFSDTNVYTSLVESCPLSVASGLDSVLASSHPPTPSFFLNLPHPTSEKYWAIYCLWFTKSGEKPKIYIDSGTDADTGVHSRLTEYHTNSPSSLSMPRFIRQALEKGWILAHSSVFCWTPRSADGCGVFCWRLMPSDGVVDRLRARIPTIQAVSTITFHTCIAMSTDCDVEPCSHSPGPCPAGRSPRPSV